MYQIDGSTVAATLPAPAAAGTVGYFTDGNLLAGVAPTIVPADFLNSLMLELLNIVTAAGLVPSKTQDNQVLLAIEELIEVRAGNYLVDTGAVNAYVVVPNPAITSYPNGLPIKFRATHANTGACTLSAGGGPVGLLRDDGSALQSGDVPLNGIVNCTYDSVAGAFLVNSIVPSQLGALAKLNIGTGLVNDGGNLAVNGIGNYSIDTGAANAYVIALTPAITSYAGKNGLNVKFRATHANTAASTVNVGGGVVALLRADGIALSAGDLPINGVVNATYDAAAGAFLVAGIVPSQLGTAARLNASDTLGGVSATQIYAGNPNGFVAGNAAAGLLPPSTCWDSTNRMMWICSATGSTATAAWIIPSPGSALRYVNASGTVLSGVYLADTSGGPFTLTLPASPAQGDCMEFIDGPGSWGSNNLTIGRNGSTIFGAASDLVCNVAGENFRIWFNGFDWRVQ